MKALQSFVVYVNGSGSMVQFNEGRDSLEGITRFEVEAGEEVEGLLPAGVVHDLVLAIPSFLDLKREEGVIKLSDEEKRKFLFVSENDGKVVDRSPEVLAEEARLAAPKTLKVPDRSWTEEKLRLIANEKGLKGLKEVGKLFGVTDTSINRLIYEILRVQESRAK